MVAASDSILEGRPKIEANLGLRRYFGSVFISWRYVDFCGLRGVIFLCVFVRSDVVIRGSGEAVLVADCGRSFHSGHSVERGFAKCGVVKGINWLDVIDSVVG